MTQHCQCFHNPHTVPESWKDREPMIQWLQIASQMLELPVHIHIPSSQLKYHKVLIWRVIQFGEGNSRPIVPRKYLQPLVFSNAILLSNHFSTYYLISPGTGCLGVGVALLHGTKSHLQRVLHTDNQCLETSKWSWFLGDLHIPSWAGKYKHQILKINQKVVVL